MIPYIIIISLLIYLIIKYDINSCRFGREKWENVITVLLILMAGLRYHIGSDTIQYELNFNYCPSITELFQSNRWLLGREPLWVLFMSIIKSVWNNFIFFQFVVAIIFNTLLLNFIRQTTNKTFTVFLVVYCVCWWNFNFEILRESISVILYLYSILWLSKKDYVYYLIVSLVILFIHRFSFVIVLLTPIVLFQNRKVVFTLLSLFVAYALLFIDRSFFDLIFDIIFEYSSDSVSNKLGTYIDSTNEGFHGLNIIGLIELSLLSIILPTVVILNSKKTPVNMFFPVLIGLYIIFAILKSKFSIAGRVNNYLEIIFIVEMVNTLYNNRAVKKYELIYKFLVCLFVFQGCYYFYKPTYFEKRKYITYDVRYIPYGTIFESPDETREAALK